MENSLETLPFSEILTTFNKASLFGGKVIYPTSLQNLHLSIEAIEIDSDRKMKIKLVEKVKTEDRWPVTIKLNYRNISFSIDPHEYVIEGKIISASLPVHVKAIPQRINKRFVLPLNSDVTSSLYRTEKRGGTLEVQGRILDISKKGIGIIIPANEEDLLKENDHIWIRTINSITLPTPMFGRVVYVYKRKFKDSLELKAGVALDSSLPEEILLKLQDMSTLIIKG